MKMWNKVIGTTVFLTVFNGIMLLAWRHFVGFEMAVIIGLASIAGSVGAIGVKSDKKE